MNLVSIGSIGKAVASIAYDVFNDIQVLSYEDLGAFLNAINMHTIDIHRMIISENAFDEETVTDEMIDSFVNIIQVSYPAMKLITVSKRADMTEYFAELLLGIDYVHMCVGGGNFKTTHKFIEDLISLPTAEIKAKYKNIIYNKEIKVNKEEVDMEILDDSILESPVKNEDIPGYVVNKNANKPQKRSLFDRIIGRGPKQTTNNSVVMNGDMPQIGQGFGVSEFNDDTVNPFENIQNSDSDFEVFDPEESNLGLGVDNIEIPERPETNFGLDDMPVDEENQQMGLSDDFDDMDSLKESDDGFSVPPVEVMEEEPVIEDDGEIFSESTQEEIEEQVEENTEENSDNFNVFGSHEVEEEGQVENESFVPVPIPMDISAIKDKIENTQLDLDIENIPSIPTVPTVPLDVVNGEEQGIDGFGEDFDALMEKYEDSNRKVVEKQVVVKEYVNVNSNYRFRNKNGTRILIMVGDRRVGTTKLSLNLCAKFAKNEKVLYVDFDRYRHGSLGYLDIENIMDEPEHISDGLTHYKGSKMLNNVVHFYNKGGFYTLTSMYGSDVTDEQLMMVEKLLLGQKEFKTIVIDCPVENLYILNEILRGGNVIICAEDDKIGVLNLLTALSMYCADEKQLANVYEKSYFVVGRKNDIGKFSSELADAVDLFDMDEAGFDWNKVEVLGNIKNIAELVERMNS